MARFLSDRAARVAVLIVALALPVMKPAIPAELNGELEIKSWSSVEYSSQDGSALLHDAVISHTRDMQIKAKLARYDELGDKKVQQLTLSDGVHIDYRGAILEADSALLVFRDAQLVSARVEGKQATFSHQPARSSRRVSGRADAIEFEGASNRIRFKGDTFYTDGRNECSIDELVYILTDGSFSSIRAPGRGERCTISLDSLERVPPPRTPERSTAQ